MFVDVGASTGGFTDCCAARREKVYAVDVGHGILHWKMRNDRVISMEKNNARYVSRIPEKINLVT